MTDDEFKARFIAAFKVRAIAEWKWPDIEAEAEAIEQYQDCPRSEMIDEYERDPELSANSAFDDYLDTLRLSDDGNEVLANGK